MRNKWQYGALDRDLHSNRFGVLSLGNLSITSFKASTLTAEAPMTQTLLGISLYVGRISLRR